MIYPRQEVLSPPKQSPEPNTLLFISPMKYNGCGGSMLSWTVENTLLRLGWWKCYTLNKLKIFDRYTTLCLTENKKKYILCCFFFLFSHVLLPSTFLPVICKSCMCENKNITLFLFNQASLLIVGCCSSCASIWKAMSGCRGVWHHFAEHYDLQCLWLLKTSRKDTGR